MPELIRPQWAMILGGASCVWDDIASWEKLYGLPWDGLIIAANDIGAHWPRELHHWATLHPLEFRRWEVLRHRNIDDWYRQFVPNDPNFVKYETWGKDQDFPEPLTDHVLKPWPRATSGLFAVQVAKELGCTRAILCGIPMTPTAHFVQTQERFEPKWHEARRHWSAWPRNLSHMHGWVKSMSGQTQELLGDPTLEWLLAA